jgi:hypothetical protein
VTAPDAPATPGLSSYSTYAVGTPFTGSFTFDPSTAVSPGSQISNPNSENSSNYTEFTLGPSTTLTLQVGNKDVYTVSGPFRSEFSETAETGVPNAPNPYKYSLLSLWVPGSNAAFQINLGSPGTWINPDNSVLPFPTLSQLQAFSLATFVVAQSVPGGPNFNATADTFTVVPEPASATIFCLLGAVLILRKFRK